MRSEQQKAVLSSDEIAAAVRALTASDWIRLRRAANYWSAGRPIGAKDLLQKAFLRALDGGECPSHVSAVRFLEQAMRSIAHGESEKKENKLVLVSTDASEPVAQRAASFPDAGQNPEMQMISEENVAEIRSAIVGLFADDPIAQIIAEGLIDGNEGEELRALCDLDEIAYNSKRRLVRRRIDKAYPEGWPQ